MTRLPLLGCAGCAAHLATAPFPAPAPASVDLDAPGPITHEAVVSARWSVPLHGLVDLDDPRAASLEDGDHPIVLPVHVLTHPTAGVFVVDTGVPRARSPERGVMRWFARDIEPVETLAAILERQGAPLAGVLLTHGHLDHVLGLVDVPAAPVHAGAGEERPDGFAGHLMFPTLRRGLGGRALTTWDFEGPGVVRLDGVPAIDVLGDGSLYALAAPGHTAGSTAYLARTPEGPVLFVGDCSHTRWGWEHGVTPGTYTADHDANAASLEALRRLAAAHPSMRVEVGHEEAGPNSEVVRGAGGRRTTCAEVTAALAAVPDRDPAVASELATLLGELVAVDQAARKLPSSACALEVTAAADARSRRTLLALLERPGWVGASTHGAPAAHAAWLLVQHQDADRALQQRALDRMTALPAGEVSPADVAYLWDRLAVAGDRPQRYGTQGGCVGPGVWRAHPVEAPDQVDALRAAAGIRFTSAEYGEVMNGFCAPPPPAP